MTHPSSRMHFSAIGMRAVLLFTLGAGCTPVAPEGPAAEDADPPSEVAADPQAGVFDTMEYRIRLVTVADGLSYPYSMAFLPDGDMLFTEMEGRLRLIRDGELRPESIGGVPEVYHTGASKGLMDVALHPDFADNTLVYLTYNTMGADGSTMVLGRGSFDGAALNDFEELFVANAWAMTNGRQNARIVFAPDGMLYMSVSVGGGGPQTVRAQQMDDHAGKILRLRDDGTPAPGNPFLGREGYRPEIYTIGHQNVHGLVVHPDTGEVWDLEHGDEANTLTPGGNYGWPYTSVGGGRQRRRRNSGSHPPPTRGRGIDRGPDHLAHSRHPSHWNDVLQRGPVPRMEGQSLRGRAGDRPAASRRFRLRRNRGSRKSVQRHWRMAPRRAAGARWSDLLQQLQSP